MKREDPTLTTDLRFAIVTPLIPVTVATSKVRGPNASLKVTTICVSRPRRGVVVSKRKTVVTLGPTLGRRVSKVSKVAGIGGAVVAKRRTVVMFFFVLKEEREGRRERRRERRGEERGEERRGEKREER